MNGDLANKEDKKPSDKKPEAAKKAEAKKDEKLAITPEAKLVEKPKQEAKKETPKAEPVKAEKKEEDGEKKPEAPKAIAELSDEEKQKRYMENQIKKASENIGSKDKNPEAEGTPAPLPLQPKSAHVQTLDPFASSFKADDAENYEQKHPEEKQEKEKAQTDKINKIQSTLAYDYDQNGKSTKDADKEKDASTTEEKVQKSDID